METPPMLTQNLNYEPSIAAEDEDADRDEVMRMPIRGVPSLKTHGDVERERERADAQKENVRG